MRRLPLRCGFLSVLCLSVSILAKCEGHVDQSSSESRRRIATAVPPAAITSAEEPEVGFEPQRIAASTDVRRRVAYPTVPTTGHLPLAETSASDYTPEVVPRRKRKNKGQKRAPLIENPYSYVGAASDTVNVDAAEPVAQLPGISADPEPTEDVFAGHGIVPVSKEAPRPFDMKQYLSLPRDQSAEESPSEAQQVDSGLSDDTTPSSGLVSAYSQVANSFEKTLPLKPIVPAAVVEVTTAPFEEAEAPYNGEGESHAGLSDVKITSDDGKRGKRTSLDDESHEDIKHEPAADYDEESAPLTQDNAQLTDAKYIGNYDHHDESGQEHGANYEVHEKKSSGGGGGGGGGGGHGGHGKGKAGGGAGGGGHGGHGGHGKGKAGGGGGGGGGHGAGKAGGGGAGGGDHKFEKGGGEEHEKHEHSSHGEKGDKGYKGVHEFDKGEKGHHDKESHANNYAEKKGEESKHHAEGGYHGEHHHGEKGTKEASFGEEGKHQKGHNTKGEHFVHKKDEYEKKTEFFDEFHEDGGNEKGGEYHHEHSAKKGGHHKSGHHEAAEHDGKHGKEKKHEEGHHFHDHKGHKKADGHEVHHDHLDKIAKKEDHHEGKKWTYKKGDDGGGGGGGGGGGEGKGKKA